MVSTRPPTSKSSSPFSNPLVTVPNAPITIGIIVTCMFHSFFNSLARSRYLSLFSHSFSFTLWSAGTAKSTILQVLFFLLIIIKSGLLAGIRWSVCMLKSHRSLCEAFSRTGAQLCIYHLLEWSNLNFLHISQWITLPTQSSLALYSRCANLLHSLIIWLMVSSLSPHSLHLLFCWVLPILTLIWLVLIYSRFDMIGHSLRFFPINIYCPVGWGCRIHRLHLCRGVRPPPMSVLDMALNNLMVRFLWCLGFGECWAPLHCHRSPVHSGLEG